MFQLISVELDSAEKKKHTLIDHLGRHGFAQQELLEHEERLLRAVQRDLVPGAADGDQGQPFVVLHAPAAANLGRHDVPGVPAGLYGKAQGGERAPGRAQRHRSVRVTTVHADEKKKKKKTCVLVSFLYRN
jgi:hypothetical protein